MLLSVSNAGMYIFTSQQSNVLTFSLTNLMILYFVYSVPVFFIGGIPVSHLADKLVMNKKKINSYAVSLLIYGSSGLIVNYFWYVSFLNSGWTRETCFLLILGIFASLLFFHILLLIKKLSIRWKQNCGEKSGS